MNPPLAGRRVVVTRASEQAESLAARLRELGAEPVLLPLIRIVEPSDGGAALNAALADLASYDWLVVTSPNGADRVRATLDSTLAEVRPRIAAVGRATAEALGRPADLVPSAQTGAALAAEFPSGSGRVLVTQAEDAGQTVAAGLAARGWDIRVVAAYRTVAAPPSAADLLAVLSADAVLFASGSAVRAWVQVMGTSTPAIAVAIGPSTAAIAAQFGLKIDIVAADHSLDGMVSALLSSLRDPH